MGERAAAVGSTSSMLTPGGVSPVPPASRVMQMVRHKPSMDAIIEYKGQVWKVKTTNSPNVVLVPHPGGGKE